jgi:hypothetical protein
MKVSGLLHNPTTVSPKEQPPLSAPKEAGWANSQHICFGKRKSLADVRKKDHHSTGPPMGFLLNYVIKLSNFV